jgi:hypothetical protein
MMKSKKEPKKKPIEITYHFIESADAELRLNRAFDVLFNEIIKKYKKYK